MNQHEIRPGGAPRSATVPLPPPSPATTAIPPAFPQTLVAQPRCPSTHRATTGYTAAQVGVQCKYTPVHLGDHCGYVNAFVGDVFWPQEKEPEIGQALKILLGLETAALAAHERVPCCRSCDGHACEDRSVNPDDPD